MRTWMFSLAVGGLLGPGCAARIGCPVEVVRVVTVPVPVAATPAPAPAAGPPKAVAKKPPPDPVADRRERVEEAKDRTAFVPLLGEAETKEAVPSIRRFPVAPTLTRASASMPKTLEAEMRAWMALQREGTLDRRLMQEVFLVVSSANECGY